MYQVLGVKGQRTGLLPSAACRSASVTACRRSPGCPWPRDRVVGRRPPHRAQVKKRPEADHQVVATIGTEDELVEVGAEMATRPARVPASPRPRVPAPPRPRVPASGSSEIRAQFVVRTRAAETVRPAMSRDTRPDTPRWPPRRQSAAGVAKHRCSSIGVLGKLGRSTDRHHILRWPETTGWAHSGGTSSRPPRRDGRAEPGPCPARRARVAANASRGSAGPAGHAGVAQRARSDLPGV